MKRPFGHLNKDPGANITRQLQGAMDNLRSNRGDLNDRLRTAELAGQTPTHQVRDCRLAKFAIVDVKVVSQKSQMRIRMAPPFGASCINRRVEESLADNSTLSGAVDFETAATRLPPSGVQEVPAAEMPSNLRRMGSHLSQLQAHIQDDDSTSRIIGGIWGMGGVGKTTTLLQGFNNDLLLCSSSESAQTPPAFDYIIWIVASKDYKVVKLQRHISERLGPPKSNNKNFLLLLDDIWQPVDLAEVVIPHPVRLGGSDTGSMKQKVVFTRRLEAVCGQMKLECLRENEAWQLFQYKVGEETIRAHARIPELARRVAEECDGLPLALVVIGATMSMKKTPQEWQNTITMLQKLRPNEILQGMEEKIMLKLKVSYDNLTDDIIRMCFLPCCLWPEDHSILKTDIIDCWMGHGLVDECNFDNINEAYDSGHALIGILQAACLLERGDDKEREVKMHDVIRDLTLWITPNYGDKPNTCIMSSGAMAYNTPGEVKRIWLLNKFNVVNTSRLPTDCKNLETLSTPPVEHIEDRVLRDVRSGVHGERRRRK